MVLLNVSGKGVGARRGHHIGGPAVFLGNGRTWRWPFDADKNKMRHEYKIKMAVISTESPTKLGTIGGLATRGVGNKRERRWLIVEKGGATMKKRQILTSSGCGRADLVAVDSLAELAMVLCCRVKFNLMRTLFVRVTVLSIPNLSDLD